MRSWNLWGSNQCLAWMTQFERTCSAALSAELSFPVGLATLARAGSPLSTGNESTDLKWRGPVSENFGEEHVDDQAHRRSGEKSQHLAEALIQKLKPQQQG